MVDYYIAIVNSYWASYLLASLIFLWYLIASFVRRSRRILVPAYLWCLVAFFAVLATSTIANFSSVESFAVGFKIYVPMSLLIPVVVSLKSPEIFIKWLEKGALILPIVELPFVLHQHFVVAPRRLAVSWDAVVGTFGGNPLAGGASSTLMLFSIVSILVAIEMRQTRRLSTIVAVTIVLISMANILLGEVKAVFIFLPVALLVQQTWQLVRNPLKLILWGGLIVATLIVTATVYETLYWSQQAAYGGRLNQILSSVFDPNNISYQTGEISRGASLAIWWNDNQLDTVARLIGNGAASARVASTVAVGPIGARYAPFDIGATAISQLLWDTGVVGTFFFASSLIMAGFFALRLASRRTNRVHRMQLMTIAAIIFVLVGFLLYNRSLVDRPAEQMLTALLYGLLGNLPFVVRATRENPKNRLGSRRMLTSAGGER